METFLCDCFIWNNFDVLCFWNFILVDVLNIKNNHLNEIINLWLLDFERLEKKYLYDWNRCYALVNNVVICIYFQFSHWHFTTYNTTRTKHHFLLPGGDKKIFFSGLGACTNHVDSHGGRGVYEMSTLLIKLI